MSDGIEALDEIARGMARDIRPLYAGADLPRYYAYLRAMYHYTLESGAELRHAASISAAAEAASLFGHMAAEEEHHHVLAQADLAALGQADVGSAAPSVLAFRAFWNAVPRARAAVLLGALYALENVARFARADALKCLGALQLQANQARFVTVHLLADEHHGQAVADACRRVTPEAREAVCSGARQAARLWVAIHLDVAPAAPRS